MADATLTLEAKFIDNVSTSIRSIQSQMEKMELTIHESTGKIADDLKKMKDKTDDANEGFGKLQQGIKSWVSNAITTFATAVAGALAFEKLSEFVGASREAYEKHEQAALHFDAVFEANGKSIGIAKSQLEAMATQLQRTTNFTTESAMAAEVQLMTFDKIGRDVFPRALKAAADVAEIMGTDLAGAAKALGVALEDPSQGMRKLRQMNVILSEAEKEQIKDMEAAGNLAGAQKMILDKIESSYGGIAEKAQLATAATSHFWKDVMVAVGQVAMVPFAELSEIIKKLSGETADAFRIDPIEVQRQAIEANITSLEKLLTKASRAPQVESLKKQIEDLKDQAAALDKQMPGAAMPNGPVSLQMGDAQIKKLSELQNEGEKIRAESIKDATQREIVLENAKYKLELNEFAGYSKLIEQATENHMAKLHAIRSKPDPDAKKVATEYANQKIMEQKQTEDSFDALRESMATNELEKLDAQMVAKLEKVRIGSEAEFNIRQEFANKEATLIKQKTDKTGAEADIAEDKQSPMAKLEAQHQKELSEYQGFKDAQANVDRKYAALKKQLETDSMKKSADDLANNMKTIASQWHEFGLLYKASAEAKNIADTYTAAMASYSWASIWGGPVAGAAAAAIAVAAGLANAEKIASAKFETGGPIFGPSHSGGGVNINAEGGEFMFSKADVSRLGGISNMQAIRSGRAGGSSSVHLGDTIVQVTGQMTDAQAKHLGTTIAQSKFDRLRQLKMDMAELPYINPPGF